MQPGHEERAFIAGMAIAVGVSAGFALNGVTPPGGYGGPESHQAAMSAQSALEVQDKAVSYAKAASGPQNAPITQALTNDPENDRVYDAAFQYLMTNCAADKDPHKVAQLRTIISNFRANKPTPVKYRALDLRMLPLTANGQVVKDDKGQKLGVIASSGCEADAQKRLFGTPQRRQQAHVNVANLQQLRELADLALNLDAEVGVVKNLWSECMSSEYNFRVTGVEASAAKDMGATEAFDTASADCRTKVNYNASIQIRRNAVETAISSDYPGVLSTHWSLRDHSTRNARQVLDQAAAAHGQ